MLSNHGLPYVGRFACDWRRLSTTDPHTATRWECRPGPRCRRRREGRGGRGMRGVRAAATTWTSSGAGCPEGAGGGGHRGPAGDHVVDQEDPGRWVSDGSEGGTRPPRLEGLAGLGRTGRAQEQPPAGDAASRPPEPPGDGPGEELGLVEAPLPAAGVGGGGPGDHVDRDRLGRHQRGHPLGQERHRRPGVAVLQPGHQLPPGPLVGQQRGTGVDARRRRAATAPAATPPRTGRRAPPPSRHTPDSSSAGTRRPTIRRPYDSNRPTGDAPAPDPERSPLGYLQGPICAIRSGSPAPTAERSPLGVPRGAHLCHSLELAAHDGRWARSAAWEAGRWPGHFCGADATCAVAFAPQKRGAPTRRPASRRD